MRNVIGFDEDLDAESMRGALCGPPTYWGAWIAKIFVGMTVEGNKIKLKCIKEWIFQALCPFGHPKCYSLNKGVNY